MASVHPGDALHLTLMDVVVMALEEVCFSKRGGLWGDIWQWDTLLFCGDSVSSLGKGRLVLCQKGHPVSAMLALSLREQ